MFQRKFAPKHRTGCVTCKIRRVKCDESKPHCSRCLSTGRKCDGYLNLTQPKLNAQRVHPQSALICSDTGSVNVLEGQAFSFFRHCTVPGFAGFFHDDAWNRIIPQLVHAEPAIRHAVNALVGLDRRFWIFATLTESCNQTIDAFSTKHYIKALGHFRALLVAHQTPATTILTCLLLFIHFEAMRENFSSALLHIRRMSLLQKTVTKDIHRVEPSIRDALTRVDIQTSAYIGSRAPDLALWGCISLPDGFHNMAIARQITNLWTCRMFLFLRLVADHIKYTSPGNVPMEAICESKRFEDVFSRLNSMLEQLEERCKSKGYHDQPGFWALKIRVKMNRILCIGCLYAEESIYDAYLDDFRDILHMCQILNSMNIGESTMSSVLLDEELLQPLNHIAKLCRDGYIRHKALDELQKLAEHRRSRYIHIVWKMVERCVELEEESSEKFLRCHHIPEWRRIHSCGFDALQNAQSSRVRVRFKSLANGMDGGWKEHEEIISW